MPDNPGDTQKGYGGAQEEAADIARATEAVAEFAGQPKAEADAEEKDPNAGKGSKRERFNAWLRSHEPLVEFCVSCAAIIGLLLLAWQTYETRRSTNASLESLNFSKSEAASSEATKVAATQLEYRAWVGISDAKAWAADVVYAEITVKNHGRTPAMNYHTITGCALVAKGQPIEPDKYVWGRNPSPPFSMSTIFPGETAGIAMMASRRLIQDLKANPDYYRLVMYGRVEYDDVFGKHHTSRFCFVKPSESVLKRLESCQTYDHAD